LSTPFTPLLRYGKNLEMGVMVGIDPESDVLRRAAQHGAEITADGVGPRHSHGAARVASSVGRRT